GSESRPPMLNKENYVSWSSRLLRYAKSRPNGKLIHNSILNGPFVRRMIAEPGATEDSHHLFLRCDLATSVKGRISRVSPMKSKVTGKSDSHKIVKESDTAPVVIEKSIGKPAIVKEKPDLVNEKPAVVKEKSGVDKADIPKDKHKVHPEVPVLRSKPEVKAKSSVCEHVKRKRILSKEDHSKKKPEVDSDSLSNEVSDRKPKTGRLRLSMDTKGIQRLEDSRQESLCLSGRQAHFRDCGIFTMLHMESYMGQTAKRWDCGLVAESKQQCDMLRLLRFKFPTKILLHEINVHAQKMIRYAEKFDKIADFEKMCKVVNSLKNRKEREKN
nr:ulp1 protease family, C-terminal catalytic domain-containing protein [Tanacetum cinerariifolium]